MIKYHPSPNVKRYPYHNTPSSLLSEELRATHTGAAQPCQDLLCRLAEMESHGLFDCNRRTKVTVNDFNGCQLKLPHRLLYTHIMEEMDKY